MPSAIGQVEAPGFLVQVGRRQVDRDAAVVGKGEPALSERGTDPVARLLDFGVGQADERGARQAVRQMHLDRDRCAAQSVEGTAVDDGERHGPHHASAPVKAWPAAPTQIRTAMVQDASICAQLRRDGLVPALWSPIWRSGMVSAT
jgi:hypothetical protein